MTPEADTTAAAAAPPEADSVLQALAKIHLFHGIAERGLARIAAIAQEESYKMGQVIFKEGETGGSLYLILEGKVRISREVSGMGEEALAVLREGDAFGEMALIDAVPRSADARVHEACRLLVISKDGKHLGTISTDDLVANCAWGDDGSTLYMTTNSRLARVKTKTRGAGF